MTGWFNEYMKYAEYNRSINEGYYDEYNSHWRHPAEGLPQQEIDSNIRGANGLYSQYMQWK